MTLENGPTRREPQICGDVDLRIDADGTWYYHGSPIGRKELVRLFARVLVREADGYWLKTPAEKARIQVEDVPFLAVELTVVGSGRTQELVLRTNVDDLFSIDAEHPLRVTTDPANGSPTPYATIRPGIEARVVRSVYYELVGLGVEEKIGTDQIYGIWSKERFFPLAPHDRAP